MGETVRFEVTPTITAGAYSVNDALGNLKKVADVVAAPRSSGTIVSVELISKVAVTGDIDVVFFGTEPAGTADNAPFAPSDAEAVTIFGILKIRSADWAAAFANNVVAFVETSIGFELNSVETPDIWMQMRTRTADTYAATTDLTLVLMIDRGDI